MQSYTWLQRPVNHAINKPSIISPSSPSWHEREHKFVDMVSNLDFCSSYSETNKYRATVVQGIDIPEELTKSFLQYKADNIDHASRTLDGYGSVHVMGQITTFTPVKFHDSRWTLLNIRWIKKTCQISSIWDSV